MTICLKESLSYEIIFSVEVMNDETYGEQDCQPITDCGDHRHPKNRVCKSVVQMMPARISSASQSQTKRCPVLVLP